MSEDKKANCIGARLPNTQYDKKDVHLPAGDLLIKWNNENNGLYSTIDAICREESNHTRVYRKLTVLPHRSHHLFILTPSNGGPPVPTIVVMSRDKGVAKRTLDIIEKHPRITNLELGFNYFAHEDTI